MCHITQYMAVLINCFGRNNLWGYANSQNLENKHH